MTIRKRYVLGFMFDPQCERVALIEKQTPEWQAGKLNGIGGKIEPDETALTAMVREFYEETGVPTNKSDWSQFCILSGLDYEVQVYAASSDVIDDVKTTTKEQVSVFHRNCIDDTNAIPNLTWLIPFARLTRMSKDGHAVVF